MPSSTLKTYQGKIVGTFPPKSSFRSSAFLFYFFFLSSLSFFCTVHGVPWLSNCPYSYTIYTISHSNWLTLAKKLFLRTLKCYASTVIIMLEVRDTCGLGISRDEEIMTVAFPPGFWVFSYLLSRETMWPVPQLMDSPRRKRVMGTTSRSSS